MASLQLVFLSMATAYIAVQAQNNQPTCDVKAIVRELKAELTKDNTIAMIELKEMLYKQEKTTEYLIKHVTTLRVDLAEKLVESQRKSFIQLDQKLVDLESKLSRSQLGQCECNSKENKPTENRPTDKRPTDCAAIYSQGVRRSGVYTIYPENKEGVQAFCDMTTDGGGWTVFQKRNSGRVDFYRGWAEYAEGFGDPAEEYWLGLRHIHALTQGQATELYVGLTDFDVGEKYSKYGKFKVSSEAEKFRLTLGSYSGTAGDSLSYHSGQKFSTKDQDNDASSISDCSEKKHGAWWYNKCYRSNLNGQYYATKQRITATAMNWYHLHRKWVSMKGSVMQLRPVSFKP